MKLRGGISGFGEVAARAHLPGWQTRPDVQIVAVHDPIPERRHMALRLINNVRVYEDLDLMLAGERLDFLDVASPPALHVQAARAALEAGAHVIVEKPLCLDLRDFDALASMAARNSRVLMCVHNWKHSPPYRLAHDLVSARKIGPLRHIAFERSRTAAAGSFSSGAKWRSDPALGGGILIDHGWHVFYLMRWLMDDSPVEVTAYLGSPSGLTVDDVADLRIVFSRGAIGYCHLSWRAPARRTLGLLFGERAILEIDSEAVRLTDRAGKTEAESITTPDAPDDSYHASWFRPMAEEFESAVQAGGGNIAAVNFAEARIALSLTLAARQSHRDKKPITLLS